MFICPPLLLDEIYAPARMPSIFIGSVVEKSVWLITFDI